MKNMLSMKKTKNEKIYKKFYLKLLINQRSSSLVALKVLPNSFSKNYIKSSKDLSP